MIDVRTTPAPIETVTPIKPSEAIRLGCLIAPVQGDGEFFPAPGEACVLGAMALGFGYEPTDGEQPYHVVTPRLPEKVRHPIEGYSGDTASILYRLNDADEWSRERIADWLEGLGL